MSLCTCILEKKTSGVLNGTDALNRVITVYDILLEMAYKLLLACEEMRKRHFND